jgi:hypothetical protein
MQGTQLREYGVAATINFDLFEVDGVDFRVDAVAASGDTKIMKDEGVEANAANNFVDEGNGYSLSLTAEELTVARLVIYLIDATATKVWLDKSIIIETYGNASAQHAMNFNDAVRGGMMALPNANADAAGGLPISDTGGLDLDAMNTNINDIETATGVISGDTAAILVDTGTTLDGKIDTIDTEVGLISGDVALVLVDTADMQPKLGSPVSDISADIATVKTETGVISGDTAAILVDTNSLNDTKVPDIISLANINAECDTAISDAALATAANLAIVDTEVGLVSGDTAAILVDTNEMQGKLPANNIMGSSVTTDKDDEIDAIKAVTDNLPNSGSLTDLATTLAEVRHVSGDLAIVSGDVVVIDTEVGLVSGDVAAILVDTAEIGTAGDGLTDLGGMGTIMKAEVQVECDDALVARKLDHLMDVAVANTDVADDSVIAKMTASGATADFDTFDNKSDSLEALADATTASAPTVVQIREEMDSGSVQLAQISGDTAAILVDTGTTLDGKIDTIDSNIDTTLAEVRHLSGDLLIVSGDVVSALADTNEMQGKLPTNNIMGSSVKTDKDDEIDSIKGVTDNIPDSGSMNDLATTLGEARHISGDLTVVSGDVVVIDTEVGLISGDTAEIGIAGAGLTGLGGMSATMQNQVESEVDDALVGRGLDHLINAAVANTDIADNSIIAKMTASGATADFDNYDNTTDSLEAISDTQSSIAPTAVQIRQEMDSNSVQLIQISGDTAAVLVDTSTTLDTKIDDIQGAGFASGDDSLAAIRARGDAAWGSGDTSNVPTAVENRQEMDSNSVQLAQISGDTASILVDTGTTLNNKIDTIDTEVGLVSGDVALILVDTGTTLDGKIDTIDAEVGLISGDTAQLKTESALISGDVAAILVDTGTTLDGKIDTIDTEVGLISGDTTAILTDTADMQPKLGSPVSDISADIATIDTEVGLIKTETGVISGDVAGLDGAAMRGTDSASLATVCTEGRLAELDAGNIPATTDRNEVALGVISGDTAAILVDTGTTLDTKINTIDTEVGLISGDTAQLKTESALISGDVAAILVDTGTTLDGKIDTIDTEVGLISGDTAAIKIKTDELPDGIKKNTALTNFTFFMAKSSDHVTAQTGLSITSERSLDGGAFAGTANSATEISDGFYKIDLDAADLNGDIVALRFTGTNADDTVLTIKTEA